jgi:hypothetical protein
MLSVLTHFPHEALLLMLIALPQYSTAQAVRVQTVTIKSAWRGFSPSRSEPVELIIRRQGDGFCANGERIGNGVVEALVSVLNESPMPHPRPSNLGITEAWLNENTDLAGAKSLRHRSTFRAHLDSFRTAFNDVCNIENLVPSLFTGFHTDDYPRVEVELLFDGGKVWSASSDSQYDFMIPWKVQAGAPAFTTFNADISRAVATLLPLKSVNRDRLSGESFKFRLADAVMARMEEQWLNPALSVLRPHYSVDRSEITSGVSIHYGQDSITGHQQEENALFVLRRNSFRDDLLRDWVILPFRNETIYGAANFLKAAANYENLTLSIPWLNEIRQGRSIPIDLQFVQERSLSAKAMSVFASDMNGKGRADLATLVGAVQEQTALIMVQNAYCLILPDKKVILWRFHNPPGSHTVLKWTREELAIAPCSSYQPIAEWCSGAVISPDGSLVQ